MTTWITVCDTCKRQDWTEADAETDGAKLAALIEASARSSPSVRVRRHSCLMGCSAACNVTVQSAGKIGYTLGQFDPGTQSAEAIVGYAALHAESATGQVPYRTWPTGVKGHFITRHSAAAGHVTVLARDHGGGIDAAAQRFGGARRDWLDLSTGINPVAYSIHNLPADAWRALPDRAATDALTDAARKFWGVPDRAEVLAAPGASALIARIPALAEAGRVHIPGPTYNEHAAAFRAHGWVEHDTSPQAQVLVNPNNPDGRHWSATDAEASGLTVIDESFCDVTPDATLIRLADRPGLIVLKSFGKFWGLAGLRLGFAIGDPALLARLADWLGPWPVSGPALAVGAAALRDPVWAEQTRARLQRDAARLDALMATAGAHCIGGTSLFRLYDTPEALAFQERLAGHRIWSRVFPYSDRWVRLGLPGPDDWPRLEQALA